MKKNYRGIGFYIGLVLIVILVWYLLGNSQDTAGAYTYAEFEKALDKDEVVAVTIQQNREIPTGVLRITLKNEQSVKLNVSDVNDAQQLMEKYDFDSYVMRNVPSENWLTSLLPLLVVFAAMFILFMMMNNQNAGAGGNSKMMNFGKSRAKMSTDENKKVTFDNVAGLREEKEELEEIVDFLRSPRKYTKLGARIPKGVLLVGPPGTGKTLLAKAVAGEAGVPFFSLAGSDFVEMFVGVGASRVRDLFKEAQKQAPCIIFIDEIDAIGKSRDSHYGGGNDEREQTLNQLLAEMDGFDTSKGLLILAATNRPEVLDKALLRPGRFDRRIIVDKPDLKGRVETLRVHSKDVKMDDSVDLDAIALATAGCVGSDLANMINEAAINAVKNGRQYVTQADLF